MKWNLSDMHWKGHVHLPRMHAIHLHPIHWLVAHPMMLALLIAGLIAALVVTLTQLANTGIQIDVLDGGGIPV